MAYTASFRRGAQSIDLSSGYYQLDRDFTPPGTNTAWNVAEGLYGNRNGGEYAGDKPLDREMTFRVKVNGDSAEHGRALANALVSFLRARDPQNPTQFWYKPNTLPEPLWGQFGASLRYEIVTADASVGELYGLNGKRAYRYFVNVTLRVKPEAIGAQQRVANAAGGIIEDVLGAADGVSKGLKIPEATTNKIVNPVFGASTYDTGWTATTVTASKNIDPLFCLPGLLQSVKLVATAAGRYTVSLNVGNTNSHTFTFYVKRQDSAAVTSADCAIYYNNDKAATYTSLGDGWYRVEWTGAGINSATTTGLSVAAGHAVYLGGAQVEEKAYATSLCYGDMLGCAWTSTAHASTSTRTAAYVRMPVGADTIMPSEGSALVVWKTPEANTLAGDRQLLRATSNLNIYYGAADDKFYFLDGTNTVSSSAQTFTAFEALRLYFVWSAAGIVIYKNGASIGTGSYTIPDLGAYLYVGASSAVASHANGAFPTVQTYDHALTQAEVTAIDGELSAVIAAGKRPAPIPWLWTKDGDGQIDNCDDSTRDNWMVIGGVAGSAAAKYKHYIQPSAVKTSVWIGGTSLPDGVFVYPNGQWFLDMSGTNNAAYCGGAYVDITDATSGWATRQPDLIYGIHNIFVRVAKASGTGSMTVTPDIAIGTYQNIGKAKTYSISTTAGLYFLGRLNQQRNVGYKDVSMYVDRAVIEAAFSTGGAAINFDYIHSIPGKLARIYNNANDGLIAFDGKSAAVTAAATGLLNDYLAVIGDEPDILPQRYNIVWGVNCGDGEAHVLANTLTFTTFITPRWSLL